MKITVIMSVLILGAGIISCKKEVVTEEVTVSISLIEPAENDTVQHNAELHMEGTISGSGQMHGYTLSLINKANDSLLYSFGFDTHSTSYSFHEHWINNVIDTTLVKFRLDVEKDHFENHEIREVNLVCLP